MIPHPSNAKALTGATLYLDHPFWQTTVGNETVRKIPLRQYCNRAAVSIMTAVIHGAPHLLMIQRARRAGDPWSGQMAFPGGRQSPSDHSILHTACRETEEEVGIDPAPIANRITRLSDLVTRSHHSWKPQVVTPFLFELSETPPLRINHEAHVEIWIPTPLFLEPVGSLPWSVGPFTVALPCHYYQDYPIWGLSLLMIRGLQKSRPELFAIRN